jgi:hypothetical protein
MMAGAVTGCKTEEEYIDVLKDGGMISSAKMCAKEAVQVENARNVTKIK